MCAETSNEIHGHYSIDYFKYFSKLVEMVIKIIDILTYLLLLGLGIYFIHHGAVFERFLKKRTQYAEYLEDVTELPTILTYVMFKEKPLEYGSHYNISLMIDSTKSEGTNLTSGINTVFNSSLRVSFEEQKEFSGNIGDAQEKRRVRQNK